MDREKAEEGIKRIVSRAEGDGDVLGVVVFGSFVDSESFNDVDIALVVPEEEKRFDKLLEYQPYDDFFDISIFQDLPVYVRIEVVRNGEIRYFHDFDRLYDIFFRTVQDFERFEPFYRDYLEGVVNG